LTDAREGLLMRDVEKTLRTLTDLKKLGIRIAVDDFGTGCASLTTLQRFPLDTVKIDRSLTREAGAAVEDAGLADAPEEFVWLLRSPETPYLGRRLGLEAH
jgi:EAL domain-containing protein (putative c-di-GMP-specific phosphodiesterase class I)